MKYMWFASLALALIACQGNTQENPRQGVHTQKDQDSQKNHDSYKKGNKESAASGSITQESQTDRDDQAKAGQADADPVRATRSGGAAYRRRDSLLQPSVSRDSAARARCYAARW